MKYTRIKVVEDDLWLTYTEKTSKTLILKDLLKYPNNSIRHENVYDKLLDNINKLPIEDIEDLLLKNNCL